MTSLKRIEKVSVSLTPKQVALLLVKERVDAFRSWKDYAFSFALGKGSEQTLPRAGRMVEESIQNGMKGQPKERIAQAVRQGQREAWFLLYLARQVLEFFMENERPDALEALLLNEQMRRFTEMIAAQRSPAQRIRLATWRLTTQGFLARLYTNSAVAETIRSTHFDGVEFLYRETKETARQAIVATEEIIGVFNTKSEAWSAPPIDLDAVRAFAESRSAGCVAELIDLARANLLRALDEDVAANRIIDRRLRAEMGDGGGTRASITGKRHA